MSKTKGGKKRVNPTKQHSIKCPKLYGQECKCDGYHTFEELYEHRIVLYIALCSQLVVADEDLGRTQIVWKSKAHSDGTVWDGWFVLGIFKTKGKQITYHLPMSYWDKTSFAQELEKAPEWDGHTSDDVLQRLKNL